MLGDVLGRDQPGLCGCSRLFSLSLGLLPETCFPKHSLAPRQRLVFPALQLTNIPLGLPQMACVTGSLPPSAKAPFYFPPFRFIHVLSVPRGVTCSSPPCSGPFMFSALSAWAVLLFLYLVGGFVFRWQDKFSPPLRWAFSDFPYPTSYCPCRLIISLFCFLHGTSCHQDHHLPAC